MRTGTQAALVLAGDIGGTNARLRLYDPAGDKAVHEVVLPSAGPSLEAIVGGYLARRKVRVSAAVLGVPGPVVDGVARPTNLPWVINARKLGRALDIPHVALVNDLAAIAIGCTRAPESSRLVLSPGKAPKGGNVAVISAGTGLGEAMLVWDGSRHVPCASEGGHADYAPSSAVEVDLLVFLRKKLGVQHISFERVLSGPGLGNVYDFFVDRLGEAAPIIRQLSTGDRNAKIASLGLARKSRAAAEAVDVFARIYGAESGNLALKALSLGGVYLSGRIACEIVPERRDIFLAAMRDKGRLGTLLSRMPVVIVKDSLIGLAGAGYLAAGLAGATLGAAQANGPR
jgi:glucokinase